MDIEVKDYKYKELCSIMGENPKTGKSKMYQLKNWKRYFDWVNPTKQVYRVVKVYDVPLEKEDNRKNNGGIRVGSGKKPKLQYEFDYLINSFLYREFTRNSHTCINGRCECYFTNDDISRYFGLYNDDFFLVESDISDIIAKSNLSFEDRTDLANRLRTAWKETYKKISEKRSSLVFGKIEAKEGIDLKSSVIAYKDRNDGDLFFRDEYVEKWEKLQKEYMMKNKIKTIPDIVDRGLWNDMIEYISKHFSEYDLLKKVRKAEFDIGVLHEYDMEECDRCRMAYNETVCDDILEFFVGRKTDEEMKTYRYIVDKYVRIKDMKI